ncbi:hypothetical protein V499_05211 [Pseudogymnoascus sp. VKM F-103]|uniref:RlpA-like protein double-psi beta-barrel domain-containing protein n=1 Tax=Pseudogymnoascus verrucosus TaxID=342668 RepID=A0A1B8GPQ5_9PEZI|nr:uncharacterized protein VE01_05115 [Pseudogymnoascus verrucosus]KFY74788.1 hypothetical protein V499_05211 [Pseudogymnoascus sp. VKM F-103]OBT52919.1 hypothetical protein VE04_06956 [Pseudogymnoascus sp. 24MN13]OBT97807.2 hypothetical protein VE01_05115 [Pseudogymnoascus verrucosus]
MLISTSIITILAAVGVTNALPNEKRITHDGIGSVNPNPTGALGSCGVSTPDSSMTVAISPFWMTQHAPGPYCGRKIQVTNTGPTTDNSVGGAGNTIIVTVQDTCAGCDENHVDLSVAAWNSLTNGHEFSVTGVSWHFCNVNGQC